LDPTRPQRLVERRKDDFAHAGRHLPEDRAAVVEEHLAGQTEPSPGGKARAVIVTTLVTEYEVGHDADERGREEHPAGQPEPRPGSKPRAVIGPTLVTEYEVVHDADERRPDRFGGGPVS